MESSGGDHDTETRKIPNYAASYRPISLLPILSKVLEKILLKRLLLSRALDRLPEMTYLLLQATDILLDRSGSRGGRI
jgi:hypothetical protein